MYYALIKDEKILGIGQCYCTSDGCICIEITEEQYNTIQEKGNNYYIYQDNELILNPDYEDEEANKRQEEFESKFIETSLGCYRLLPKGYANAQQSIDTINNMVNALGGLTEVIANMVLFYEKPDFSKPEQCTEEWLIEHSYNPNPMTKEQWSTFYIEFTTLYAQKMYQQALKDEA